jgi:probable HAF family extracellular repeat protein
MPATVFLTSPVVEGPPVDTQIGSISIPLLVPGQTITRSDVPVTIPYPLTPATYQISVVASSDSTFPDANPTNSRASASLAINNGRTNLGVLPGDDFSSAQAANDAGHVVGHSYSSITRSRRAFLWENGTMTSLGSLGGAISVALAINNNDEVVGYSYVPTGETHPVLWRNGTVTDLGKLPGTDYLFSEAVGINNLGQIVGTSSDARVGVAGARSWIWQNGVMTDLGTLPGGTYSAAAAINDAGQIVGYGDSGIPGLNRAWIWQNGSMTALPS